MVNSNLVQNRSQNNERNELIVSQVVIENPVLNGPFEEPNRHFKFTDEGITNEVILRRRTSSYFVPIAQPKKKKGAEQLFFDTEWTKDRIEDSSGQPPTGIWRSHECRFQKDGCSRNRRI